MREKGIQSFSCAFLTDAKMLHLWKFTILWYSDTATGAERWRLNTPNCHPPVWSEIFQSREIQQIFSNQDILSVFSKNYPKIDNFEHCYFSETISKPGKTYENKIWISDFSKVMKRKIWSSHWGKKFAGLVQFWNLFRNLGVIFFIAPSKHDIVAFFARSTLKSFSNIIIFMVVLCIKREMCQKNALWTIWWNVMTHKSFVH